MEDIVFQRLLALVNSALWSKNINENLFSGMNDTMWNELYHFAIRHGVMAVAFDGVSHLPSELQPPLKLRMTWALSTKQIEHKYTHMFNATIDLANLFKKEDIDMMVFKGLTLSCYYPVPAHREFGDIDIYLFGKHEAGDFLMADAGKKKKNYYYKHSNHYYKGIMIENHAYFLNVHDSRKISYLNQILLNILEQNNVKLNVKKNNILYPPPDFTALFFIVHAIRHLSSDSLPLRTYCDWALFLQAHAHELDIEKWKNVLHEAGLLSLAEALTSLTFRWMEAPTITSFPIESHPNWENRIYKEMLYPIFPPCQSKTYWKIALNKYKRFHIKYKRYLTIYDQNAFIYYISKLFHSSIYHIRHPETIFTLR